MRRIIIPLLGFCLGLAIVAAASSGSLPPQRDDCRLIFIEIPTDDPDLEGFALYAPMYLCKKVKA